MDRRGFITGAVVGAAAGAGAVLLTNQGGQQQAAAPEAAPAAPEAPAINRGVKELTMVTTWPKNFPGLGMAPERAAQFINTMSDGMMTVKVHAAGELVPAFESFDAVSQGNADIFHGAAYYWQGKSKAFNFFTAVPFGMTQPEIQAWIYYGGGQQLWDELAADFNLKPFVCGNTGVQMGGWFSKEINTIEDFKGLKMRIPGLGGEVIRRLDGASIAVPGGEIFASLQSGAIDATEWVGPWNDLAMGFYRVAQYYYSPGFHEPGSALEFTMNKGVYDGLTDSEKNIIEAACHMANDLCYAEYNARNSDSLDELITEHGVQLREFPEDVKAGFAEKSAEVMAEIGAEDGITKRVYDSFRESLRKSSRWSGLAEQAYMTMRSVHGV